MSKLFVAGTALVALGLGAPVRTGRPVRRRARSAQAAVGPVRAKAATAAPVWTTVTYVERRHEAGHVDSRLLNRPMIVVMGRPLMAPL